MAIQLADPIWERQEGEDNRWYVIFREFYLVRSIADARAAWESWKSTRLLPGNSTSERVLGVSDFERAEKEYQWRRRHQSYRLYSAANDLSLFEKKRAVQTARTLNMLDLLLDRVQEIAQTPATERIVQQVDEQGNPVVIMFQPRPARDYRDASAILLEVQKIGDEASTITKLDRYISYLHDHGFEVVLEDGQTASAKAASLMEQEQFKQLPAGEDTDEYD